MYVFRGPSVERDADGKWINIGSAAGSDGLGNPCAGRVSGLERWGLWQRCNSFPSAGSRWFVPTERRVSARVGSISESATLAVDAKAKALKAAGRPGDRLRCR